MRELVTGCAGFRGSHLTEQLHGLAYMGDSRIVFEDLPVDGPKVRARDVGRARGKRLGGDPVVGLEEGLRGAIRYFENPIRGSY